MPVSSQTAARLGPRHPKLATAAFKLALPLLERFYAHRNIHRATSRFAAETIARLRAKLERGETVYIGGINAAGSHNTGVALIEVTRAHGPKLIFNNEEERFSGQKHTSHFPDLSIAALRDALPLLGLTPEKIDAWFAAWDYAGLGATLIRTALEEAPGSLRLLALNSSAAFDRRDLDEATRSARRLGRQLGLNGPAPLIGTAHHDCHAWYSYAASPFAQSGKPVMVLVVDGLGDRGAISLYLCEGGNMRLLSCNDSVFDSLGIYYSVMSSSQGGWTWLSSEGRYMGAAAYGDGNRASNRYYEPLRRIFTLGPHGDIKLNRSLAHWQYRLDRDPYSRELTGIMGKPLPPEALWNPDAVLRVEDIKHREDTQERLDKAAAVQMVYEDALFHLVDALIRRTGSERLVFTGGTALNAVGNMRLLERFGADYYRRELQRDGRLHLWVPPIPNDAGVTVGAAYMGAYLAGAGTGAPVTHAFYCGSAPDAADICAQIEGRDDIASQPVGNISNAKGREAVADLMAYMTSQDAIFALYQGAAETGPRALGHRSILANPCNPRTRENLNAKVKFREAIRPLAPMMTREAAKMWFELSDGASDGDYNAYNYMVLTAHAKPGAREKIPSVIHADGTGRLQIVREDTDPLTHAYLKALGRRIGVEVAVNTSFNVAGPIAQTPLQAVDTLRRAKGMDAMLIIAADGTAYAAWSRATGNAERFPQWLKAWQAETARLTN